MQISFKWRHNEAIWLRSEISFCKCYGLAPKTSDNSFRTTTDCRCTIICNGTMFCGNMYSGLNCLVSLFQLYFTTTRICTWKIQVSCIRAAQFIFLLKSITIIQFCDERKYFPFVFWFTQRYGNINFDKRNIISSQVYYIEYKRGTIHIGQDQSLLGHWKHHSMGVTSFSWNAGVISSSSYSLRHQKYCLFVNCSSKLTKVELLVLQECYRLFQQHRSLGAFSEHTHGNMRQSNAQMNSKARKAIRRLELTLTICWWNLQNFQTKLVYKKW